MRTGLHHNKDFLAGLLFLTFGGLTVYFAREYPMGWIERMGPGYFPTALGGILCLIGLYARGDASVFFTRPISLAFIVGTVLILISLAWPALHGRQSTR